MSVTGHYYGDSFADQAQMRLEAQIKRVYAEAARDIEKKIDDYSKRYKEKEKEYKAAVKSGKMTQEQFDNWKKTQVFVGQRWQAIKQDIATQIYGARETSTRMINEERKAVFVDNVNYSEYTIDKDFNFGLSFNLYDSATLTKLLRENPELVPDLYNPNKAKDYSWTKKQITSAVTQGFIQGESIPKIGQRIADKLETQNSSSMIRLARTAMTSAQNAGRIEAMHNAEDMDIEVEKLWIATLDNRTRDAHQDLDGQTAKVDEPFHSSLGDIEYPADPNADPANVWNCRCTLGWEYPKYKRDRTRIAKNEEGEWEEIPDLNYKQWQEWVANGKPEILKEVIKELTNAEKLHELLSKENPDVYEAGKLFSEIIHEKYSELENVPELIEAKRRLDELVNSGYNETIKELSWKLYRVIMGGDTDKTEEQIREQLKGIGFEVEKFPNRRDLYDALKEKSSEIIKEKTKLRSTIDQYTYTGAKSAEVLKTALSDYREMGSSGYNIKEHLCNSRSPARKYVEQAYSYYPKSWVEKSVSFSFMEPKKVNRGYYAGGEIGISGNSNDSYLACAIHELGHRFERAVNGIKSNEKDFYSKRTDGEELEWLGYGYAKYEKTRKDNFIDEYMGKDYGGTAYELVSMGFEYAYTDPKTLQKDAEMESWIYGLLVTQGRD